MATIIGTTTLPKSLIAAATNTPKKTIKILCFEIQDGKIKNEKQTCQGTNMRISDYLVIEFTQNTLNARNGPFGKTAQNKLKN